MTEDRFFAFIAALALLIWLLSSGRVVRDPKRRQQMTYLALGLVGAGILYALWRTLVWFSA